MSINIKIYGSNMMLLETWIDYPFCPKVGDIVEVSNSKMYVKSVIFNKSNVKLYVSTINME